MTMWLWSCSGNFWCSCTLENIISKLRLVHLSLKGAVKPVSPGPARVSPQAGWWSSLVLISLSKSAVKSWDVAPSAPAGLDFLHEDGL